MTRPVGKIEVWEPDAGSALYSITDFVSVYYKDILTAGVGNFTFQVYSHKDFSGTYFYPNIDVNDKIKIWLDWDTVAGDANFIGKVTKRSGPILTPTGWVREISGLSQGEVLLRRFKKNKFYMGINASAIVEEWADTLGLGKTQITADTNQPDIEVRTKTYFDLLRYISDYWLDATHKIKKDFHVASNATKDLVWKVRPFRTAGVESFTTSDFLVDPQVIRAVNSVKNDITVYGFAEKPKPATKDDWTETLTDWSAVTGTLSLSDADPKKGSYDIMCWTGGAGTSVTFKRDIPRVHIRDINTLYFWFATAACDHSEVKLFGPDSTNRFTCPLQKITGWTFWQLPLGPNAEYDAVENPNGVWTKVGSPNWWDIEWIEFYVDFGVADRYCHVDAIYFYPDRWIGSASDATSQTNYERRDLEKTDDKLHSDGDCAKRAETLLYQLKDLPIQIKIAVLGNDNVLIGDRLTMTIPSEAISADPYDVVAVENALTLDNWITQPTMVNTVNIRELLATSPLRSLIGLKRHLRELAMDEKRIR